MDLCRKILPSSSFRLPSLLFPRTWKVAGLLSLEGCGSYIVEVEVVSADVGHGACWEVHTCESVSMRLVSQMLYVRSIILVILSFRSPCSRVPGR